MKADVKLSTKFLTTQHAHQVGLLVTIEGEMPQRRAPINVALVLDRSGSMSGRPLAAAKEAATRFAAFLGPQDRLAVVTFDDDVHTVYGPTSADPAFAADAIARIYEGGSTNLSGGWLQGRTHVAEALQADGVNRVVLLTDGMANRGIVEPHRLTELAASAAAQRVTTTCIGFGSQFHEDLLRDMANAGGANYWYVERDDQMAAIFSGEIEGLVALAAQNLVIEVRLTHPAVSGVSFPQNLPVQRSADGAYRLHIGDLYATSPRGLGVIFHVDDVGALGSAKVGEVTVSADLVQANGVEHRRITMPVAVNLDGHDHPEPVVEASFLRYEAARAREDAVRQADAGDLDGAADSLLRCAEKLRPFSADPLLREEAEDLAAESVRLRERRYTAMDRKYNAKRVQASDKDELAYMRSISRTRPPRPSRP